MTNPALDCSIDADWLAGLLESVYTVVAGIPQLNHRESLLSGNFAVRWITLKLSFFGCRCQNSGEEASSSLYPPCCSPQRYSKLTFAWPFLHHLSQQPFFNAATPAKSAEYSEEKKRQRLQPRRLRRT